MAFPTTPVDGQIATINGITYTYTSATNSWARAQTTLPTMTMTSDTFTGDGSTTAYTLSVSPYAKEFTTVNIDGVSQLKSAYTIIGNVLTLTGTPILGSVIEVKTLSSTPTSVLTGLVFDTFTGDSANTTFTLGTAPTNKNYTLVSIGGVVQQKSTYNVSGTSLIFSTAPPSTSPIEVTTFGPAISSAMAAGSDAQIQFNLDNNLSGSTDLTFDISTSTLTTSNIISDNIIANTIVTSSFTGNVVGNVTGSASTVTSSAQPSITSLGTLSELTVSGASSFRITSDILTTIAGATGVIVHDLSLGAAFYHTSPASAFTANFINLPVTNNRVIMTSLIIIQGATGYLPSAVQIDGAAQTIRWLSGGGAPAANANKIDIVSFSFIRSSNSWTVLAQTGAFA